MAKLIRAPILISLIIVLPLIAASAVILFHAYNADKDQVIAHAAAEAAEISGRVDGTLLLSEALARSLAQTVANLPRSYWALGPDNPLVSRAIAGRDPHIFNNFVADNPQFANAAVMRKRGTKASIVEAALPPESKWEEAPHIKDAMVSNKSLFSDIYDSPRTELPTMDVVHPVRGPSDEVLGAVVLALNLSIFSEVEDPERFEKSRFLLVTKEGDLIARFPDPEAHVGQNISSSEVFQKGIQLPSFSGKDLTGESLFFVSRRTTRSSWLTIVGFERGELFGNLFFRLGIFLGGVVVASGAAVGVGTAYSVRLRRSAERERDLHELAEGARREVSSLALSLDDGLVMADENNRVKFANNRAEELLGFDKERLLSQSLDELEGSISALTSDPARTGEMLRKALDDPSQMHTLQFTLVKPEAAHIKCVVFPVSTEQGGWLGRGLVFRDVTRETEINQMKDEFISITSHELRTPLTSLVGFAELLVERQLDPDTQRRWLDLIRNESLRLSSIVEQLLNVSRIESGRIEFKPDHLNLHDLVDQSLTPVRANPSPKHTLIEEIPPDLPQVKVDKDKTVQVLRNLVDNAIKYSPDGGEVGVRASLVNGMVQVSIADQELGISPESLPKLFGKFSRIATTRTAGIRGTGLGLWIVKSLVELQGGKIWLESEVGKGSTFFFTMPLATESAQAPPEPSPQPVQQERT